jgi:hypothetical protein
MFSNSAPHSPAVPVPASEGSSSYPAPLEPHYKVSEIAQQWNVSEDTVRRMFSDEPGVLKIGEGSRLLRGRGKRYKRRYFVLRIPHSVLVRMTDRLIHKRPADAVADGGGVDRGRLRAG